MEESHRDWSSLPYEILHNIFQLAARRPPIVERLCSCALSDKELLQFAAYLNTTFYLCDYALVCKTWVCPAQSVLYSNVCIYSLSQLKRFSSTVEHNTSLGKMVKTLCAHEFFKMNDDEVTIKAETIELMTPLLSRYLPDLEEIKGYGLSSYTPILHALFGFHLKRLKKLSTPPDEETEKSEVENYIKCALLLKERMDSVTILNDNRYLDNTHVVQLPFHRLYDSLNQFVKLTKIHLKRETHEDIRALEYVVETCQSLKELTICFKPPSNESNPLLQNNNISNNAISKSISRPNIKKFNGHLCMSNFKNLTYIMHKFPELHGFDLELIGSNTETIDQNMFTKLLFYLNRIECYNIGKLIVDPAISTETIGRNWNTNSKPGSKNVKIEYSSRFQETRNEVQILKLNSSTGNLFSFTNLPLNSENTDWVHRKFIERNGMYIFKLVFTLSRTSFLTPATWVFPADFMTHTLSFCPNLKCLFFLRCNLKQSPHTTTVSDKKFSLIELYFDGCHLHPGTLEQLSVILPKIKQLRLGNIGYCSGDESNSSTRVCFSDIKITMPHTNIDLIIFDSKYYGPNLYLKVSVLEHEVQNYYRLNSSEEFEIIDEQEYTTGVRDGNKMDICCAKKPNLHFERPGYISYDDI